jgi:uncharacterized protein (DUF952 family)
MTTDLVREICSAAAWSAARAEGGLASSAADRRDGLLLLGGRVETRREILADRRFLWQGSR